MSASLPVQFEGHPDDVPLQATTQAWDANAETRLAELQAGDPAYNALTNLMIEQVEKTPGPQRIIDAGCGLGFLALALAQRGHHVVGVDPSEQSIALAKATHPAMPNLQFYTGSLEQYAQDHPDERFDTMLANMVLHAVPRLPAFMATASELLSDQGQLLATTPSIEYPDRKGVGSASPVPGIFKRAFAIRDHDPHPEPVHFFHYQPRYVIDSAAASHLKVMDFFWVKDPLTLRPDDIFFWRFQPGKVTPW